MAGYMGNDGQMYYFEDVNDCNDHLYWFSSEGTLFDTDDLIAKAVAITPNPTVTYLDFYNDIGTTPEAVLEASQNQWLWIIGSPYITGLACYYDSTSHKLVLCRYSYDSYYQKNVPHEVLLDAGYRFYICYKTYYSGASTSYSALIMSDSNKNFTVVYQVLVPTGTPPVPQVVLLTKTLPRLSVAESMPLISLPNSISGICAYSGTTAGAGLNVTVGGASYGVFKQAWMSNVASQYVRQAYFPFLAENPVIPKDDSNINGPSTTGGGDGQIQMSIDIPKPSLPPDMLLGSGVIKMYTPSANELNAFMHYIYSAPDNIIANFKKIWANPMQSIISFSIVPFVVTSDGSENVKFCGVDSGISMAKVKSQFMEVSCGVLNVPQEKLVEENASALDYSSFTKVSIYLPFCGINSLNVDDCMNAILTVDYNIDLLTGDCVAFVTCNKQDDDFKIHYNSVLYTFKGNVLAQSPLAGNDYQQLYNGVLNIAGLSAGMIAAPSVSGAMGIASEVMSPKINVSRSGAVIGNTGHLSGYKPYLIVERPISSKPEDMNRLIGYPTNIYYKMVALKGTGYTEIEKDSAKIENIKCTDAEREMIKNYLETGVVF